MLKKTIALLLCLCLLPALAACGAEEAGSDPNAGLYEAATAEMLGIEIDISDMYEKGFSIELKDKGKCAFNIDGQKGSGKWTLDGEALHVEGGGLKMSGTLSEGVMTLENLFDLGLNMTLLREGAQLPTVPAAPETGGAASGIAGYYPLFRAVIEGVDYDYDTLSELDIVDGAYLLLNEDGTGEIGFSGEVPDALTYDEEAALFYIATGETFPFTLEGDQISLYFEGSDMTLFYKLDSDAGESEAAG